MNVFGEYPASLLVSLHLAAEQKQKAATGFVCNYDGSKPTAADKTNDR